MKITLFLVLQLSCLMYRLIESPYTTALSPLAIATGCDSIPELNQGIIDFVTPKIKKKVGRGECWDLANEALLSIDAKWNGKYVFGRLVDDKTECVFPGDIIQMESLKTVKKEGNRTDIQEFPHHTAIIYEVKGPGKYVLAHQNTEFTGKKVGLSELDLAYVVKGHFKIYRPVR